MDEWKLKWWEGLVLLWGGALVLGVLLQFTIGWGVISAWLGGPDASGWVQAIGSLIGLAIAIGVPWRTHIAERKLRREEARAQALAAALSIREELEQLLGFAQDTVNQIAGHARGLNMLSAARVVAGCSAVTLPSDDQIQRILAIDRSAANALARGSSRYRQIVNTVKVYGAAPEKEAALMAIADLLHFFYEAMNDLEYARLRLIDICKEVPEFTLPSTRPARASVQQQGADQR